MYLHIGDDKAVRSKDVVAVFNVSDNKEFLSALTKDTEAENEFDNSIEAVKSVVVTNDKKYLSAISSLTLGRRILLP
jgi:hypothetical protein